MRRRFMRCFAVTTTNGIATRRSRRRRQLHLPKAATPRVYGFIFDTVAVCLHSLCPHPQIPLPASSAVCAACAYSLCLPLLAFIFLVASFLVLLTVLVQYTYICSRMCMCTCVCVYVCKHVFGAAFWKCEMPMKCNKA